MLKKQRNHVEQEEEDGIKQDMDKNKKRMSLDSANFQSHFHIDLYLICCIICDESNSPNESNKAQELEEIRRIIRINLELHEIMFELDQEEVHIIDIDWL